ncbi:MAG TPA: AraC family transcriptional regulator [Armatimonadota bacterium]|nr:AraC family transcriptional regulator [Armatimonadota bacterium]
MQDHHIDQRMLASIDLTIARMHLAIQSQAASANPVCVRGRNCHGIVYILGGSARYGFQGFDGERVAQYGDVLLLPEGAQYTIRYDEMPYEYFVADFDTTDVEDFTRMASGRLLRLSHPETFENQFRFLTHAWFLKHVGYRVRCKELLLGLLYLLLRELDQQSPRNVNVLRIAPAVEYMETHYADSDVNTELLAQLLDMSCVHFRRLFHEAYGTTPSEYLQSIRIAHAKDLLWHDHDSIEAVAEQTGFSNIYYFSRVFKQQTGVPPSKWRNEQRMIDG